jgi:hypothetical protein
MAAQFWYGSASRYDLAAPRLVITRIDPHLHSRYAEFEITVGISDGLVTGQFPRRALVHVLERWELHREEPMANWERARALVPLEPIPPLE